MKKVAFLITATALLLAMGSMDANAAWYSCKVERVLVRSTGDTEVFVYPGDGETGFTGRGRILITQAHVGSTRMLATCLTAISMANEVRISVSNVPSNTIQNVTTLGMIIPGIAP